MKILLLGANGQVGWELRRSLSLLGEVIAYTRKEANLEDLDGLRHLVENESPDLIVNAAAYTNVDKSESVPEHAALINSKAVATLAKCAHNLRIPLIHYSTDYVYDGNKKEPYQETDETGPLNVYGQSKLDGEKAIIESGCDHLIFRTSWVYDSRGKNFIKTILRLASEGREELPVICDQFGAPTSAELIADLTALILSKMDKNDSRLSGGRPNIYHLVAAGETNWCDYAKYILDQSHQFGFSFSLSSEKVRPILAKDYNLNATTVVAQRPVNSRLSLDKIQSAFGITIPHWQHYVARAVSEIVAAQKN